MVLIDDLEVQLPEGFEVEMRQAVFLGSAPPLATPLSAAPQTALRPNLIVHRQAHSSAPTLGEIMQGIETELAQAPGLHNRTQEKIVFADAVQGILLSYEFAGAPGVNVRQLQAIRVDACVSTVASITSPATTDMPVHEYRRALESISLVA